MGSPRPNRADAGAAQPQDAQAIGSEFPAMGSRSMTQGLRVLV
jgi:hypothetical protein